jgi:hypothetical protein
MSVVTMLAGPARHEPEEEPDEYGHVDAPVIHAT